MEPCCDIFAKFGGDLAPFYDNNGWLVFVRPKQVTLGASVLISRRHIESLADLTSEELLALGDAVKQIEARLSKAFHFQKINYLMLMMQDSHVHFHVIPRYSSTIEFGGISWPDSAWPKAPDMSKVVDEPNAVHVVHEALR